MDALTEEQWQEYEEKGYLKLGKLVEPAEHEALRQRIDEIMLGNADVDYDRMMMQLDSEDGDYGNAGPQTRGHKGSTLNYRKIQDLEYDRIFLSYMQLPIFRDVCRRVYGDCDISVFRAMFMNKPADRGTLLPWHQDRWTALDKDPLLTIYLAMDAATPENGCVQVIPGSHKSLINPDHPSGFLEPEMAAEHCKPEDMVYLELEEGEVALLHNWLLHSSDKNHSSNSRRAFSVCYMDAATQLTRSGKTFPMIFGEDRLRPENLQMATAEA